MKAKIIGLICGILVTPVTLFLAMISAGAGHGDYLAARLLYPIPMMYPYLMYVIPSFDLLMVISLLAWLLMCVQYPLYGWLAGAAYMYEKREFGLKLLCVHLGALAIVLIFPSH